MDLKIWTWRDFDRSKYCILSGPRKHQGESSYPAIISTMEAKYSLEFKRHQWDFFGALSVQHAIDMVEADKSICDYNDIDSILKAIFENGVTVDRYYPYTEDTIEKREELQLNLQHVPLYRVQNIRYLSFDTIEAKEQVKKEILRGPIVCRFHICEDIDRLSVGKIYRGIESKLDVENLCSRFGSDDSYRSCQVVGYTVLEDDELLLECQDTMGPDYLDKGYIWLALSAVYQLWAFDVGPFDYKSSSSTIPSKDMYTCGSS